MKRVRVTIYPGDLELPAAFERATSDEQIARVEVVNWNVAAPPAAFLLRVRGSVERFESLLRDDPAVEEYDVLPVATGECYCFVAGVGTADARDLWENFKRGSLMTIPPAEWNADGTYTFTIVGRDADIQAAVDRVPADTRVEIESVGGTKVTTEHVIDRLSPRQRAAVETAIELGYYDRPREATSDDIARELDCATSTAAEHLRKAESKLVLGLFQS
ncbi:helix-turn-helix domain-containing protein [Natrialbaceae archaeon A-arb3/5]